MESDGSAGIAHQAIHPTLPERAMTRSGTASVPGSHSIIQSMLNDQLQRMRKAQLMSGRVFFE